MQRRTSLKAGAGLLPTPALGLATPAIAQKAQVLRFVPLANPTLLDPIQTTATVTANHAYYVFDVLYSMGPVGISKPQMAEGHEVSANGRVWRCGDDRCCDHRGRPVARQDRVPPEHHRSVAGGGAVSVERAAGLSCPRAGAGLPGIAGPA